MDSARRRRHVRYWRIVNPIGKRLAGLPPWWLVLETKGRVSGQPRRTPLALGPKAADGSLLLIAVHGLHSDWVRNLEAHPSIRYKHLGRWHGALAAAEPATPELLRSFSAYARSGPRIFGMDPVLVRLRPI